VPVKEGFKKEKSQQLATATQKKLSQKTIATATQKKVLPLPHKKKFLRNSLTNQQQQESTRNSSIFIGHNNPNKLIRYTLQIPLAN